MILQIKMKSDKFDGKDILELTEVDKYSHALSSFNNQYFSLKI